MGKTPSMWWNLSSNPWCRRSQKSIAWCQMSLTREKNCLDFSKKRKEIQERIKIVEREFNYNLNVSRKFLHHFHSWAKKPCRLFPNCKFGEKCRFSHKAARQIKRNQTLVTENRKMREKVDSLEACLKVAKEDLGRAGRQNVRRQIFENSESLDIDLTKSLDEQEI